MIDERKKKAILAITHSATLEEAVEKLVSLTAKPEKAGDAAAGSGEVAGGSGQAVLPSEGGQVPAQGEGPGAAAVAGAGELGREVQAHAAIGERQPAAGSAAAAHGVWVDVLAGKPPGLLGGLSAKDVPMKSIDEQPMAGSDYVPPEDRPRPSRPPQPDKAELEAAAVMAAVRDTQSRPEADFERGAYPDLGTHGVQVVQTDAWGGVVPVFGLEPIPNDRIATEQAKHWEERRRWKGVGIGHGQVVDPKLAAQGSAAAGSVADRVWEDVLMGRPPGLLGGLSAKDVPMKPVAVEAPPAASGPGGGSAAAVPVHGAVEAAPHQVPIGGADDVPAPQRPDKSAVEAAPHQGGGDRGEPDAQAGGRSERELRAAIVEMIQRLGQGAPAEGQILRMVEDMRKAVRDGLDRQAAAQSAVMRYMQAAMAEVRARQEALEMQTRMMAAQDRQWAPTMLSSGFP